MKLFIVSDDKQNLLDNVLKDKLHKKYQGTFNLKKFLTNSIHSVANFDTLIIDFNAINDNTESIPETLKGFKRFTNARVIFLISQEEKELISDLIDIDIINIVTAEKYDAVLKEVEMCFSPKGMDINYLRRQVGLETIESIVEVNKLDLSDKELSIAFVGSMDRVGTTSIAINFCTFLSDECNANTLYVEVNKSGHLKHIANDYNIDNDNGHYKVSDKLSMITYGVDIEKEKSFNITVFDLGTMSEKLCGYLEDMDIVILVSGGKGYERVYTEKARVVLGDISYFNIINYAQGEAELGVGYMDNIFMDKGNFEVYEKVID